MENYKIPRAGIPRASALAYSRNQFDSGLAANDFENFADELPDTVHDAADYSGRMVTGLAPEFGAHELDCEFSDRDSFGGSTLAGDLHGEEFHDGMFSIFHDADDDDGLWDTGHWEDDDEDAGFLGV